MAQVFEAELLERDSEVEVIRGLAASAAAEAGVLALIEGPAGIGKSSLLGQAVAVAQEQGFETASARASELERDFAFGLVRQLFEPKLSRVAARQRADLFAGAAGHAAPLFESLDADALSPRGEASQAALHGLYWLTVNLASERPLALTIDDAHCGDAPSLRFLAYLANRVDELPVFVGVTARPADPGAEVELLDQLATSPATRLIHPEPLGPESVEELLRSALGEPDPRFAAACFTATKGNPRLLRELVATCVNEDLAPTAEQAEGVLELASRSVARSVTRRMRGLPREANQLARAVVVLGDGSDLDVVATLVDLDPQAAAAAAEALASVDILCTDALEFVHPVVRTAVYSQLSPSERARRHRDAGSVLAERGADEDEVALHLMAGRPAGDHWVVDVLRRAARRAHSRGAPDVAVTYLHRAVAEPPPAEERPAALVELGSAELAVGRMTGFVHMREALELPDDPVARARVALELGRSLSSWVDYVGAAEVFELGLAQLPDGEEELRDALEAQLIGVCFIDPSLRPRVAERMAELMEDNAAVTNPVVLTALATMAIVFIEPATTGVELAERALASGRLSFEEDPMVLVMAAFTVMAGDRLEEARRVLDRAIAEAQSHGGFYSIGLATTLRGFVHMRAGAVAAAEADAGMTLENLPDDYPAQIRWILSPLVDALLERGELDLASQRLEAHVDLANLPDAPEALYLLHSAGRLRLGQNRLGEGIAHLRECGRRLEAWGVRNPGFLPWRSSLAPALAADGAQAEALALASEEVELARAFEVPRELGMALRAAGLVEGGEKGVERLREAVEVLESSPAPLEHARALTDLGAALRRQGQRSAAREPLRAGLDLARRCGATALAERAHGELVATGARPRRLVLSGVEALTASERRVAEMATEGLTNREIAQALFVTEKTVEGHLGRAYQKLNIRSRSQLPAALEQRAGAAAS